jgi:hypothetical protein
MRIDPIFDRVFAEIYGKPAWRVSPGWGSFLTFEFGDPSLEIREPIVAVRDVSQSEREALARRRVFIHGDWHLWIYCCDWEVASGGNLIGQSTSAPSIQKAADFLDGQKLIRFSFNPEPMRCVFEFDLGGRLETYPYDHENEQWLFFNSRNHHVLVLRADEMYSYGRSDRSDAKNWKPVQIP